MSKEKVDELIKKFEAGNSTLIEEHILFDESEKSDSVLGLWAKFCRKNQLKAPHDLKKSVWNKIHSHEARRKKVRIGVLSAAASILLAVSISFIKLNKTELNYEKKEALLQEALTMLENSTPVLNNTNIIYEDELIIIYTEKE